MNCIRCGKETEENHVFCDECLKDMEQYPVKPGTPIVLPNPEERTVTKRASFKVAASKWEDRVFRLKYTIFWLVMICLMLSIALAICICMLVKISPAWLNDLLGYNPV